MAIAPDKPSLSVNPSSTSCTIHYGLTSFGDPNTGTLELRRDQPSSTFPAIDSQTTTGDFTYFDTNIWSNHSYTYYVKASNGELTTSADPVAIVSLPPNFSISGCYITASNITSNSFDVTWKAVALGTEYTVDIYSSIDEGQNYTLIAQDIQNATEYTHTFTGLSKNTRYQVLTQSRDSAGRIVDVSNNSRKPVVVIPPDAATVSAGTVTETTADINYSTSADGGFYNKTIEYSIDGGATWNTGATVSTGSASSGSFTITGLTAGTTYSVQTRTTTTAGSSVGSTLSITTVSNVKLYGSVNGGAKQITKLYGGVTSTITEYAVTGFANNINFDAQVFNNSYRNTYGRMTKQPAGIEPISGSALLHFVDSTTKPIYPPYTQWGFNNTIVTGTAYSTSTPVVVSTAKKIVKLYGSVNGSAKLIYEDNS